MRSASLLCLTLVLAAGCLQSAAHDGAAPAPTDSTASTSTAAAPHPSAAAAASPQPAHPTEAAAPDLPLGRAWTYRAETGFTPPRDVTVVVAQKSADGYLFAGATRDDLLAEAIGDVEWMGPRGHDLNDLGKAAKALDFPLADGKSWDYTPGSTLTAHAATVATPRGPERGFAIDGAVGDHLWHFEYAPSVGYFTRYYAVEDGRLEANLTLEAVGNATAYAWLTPPARDSVGGIAPSADAVLVGGGLETVFASALVLPGAQVALAPPPGGPAAWTPAPGGQPIQATVLAGAAGPWALATAPPAGGSAGLAIGATHVVTGTVGDGQVPATPAPQGTLMNGAPDSAAVWP